MSLKKSSLLIAISCYALWGILPAYWNLLSSVDPLLILSFRIIFALVFTIILLMSTGRMHVFRDTIRDKATMRYLLPSSVFITINWGLYIWAVNTGHILDSSLGYYMNPLVAFVLGILLFQEEHTRLQLAAVALAFAGVLISVIAYGSFPYISIVLALSFGAYGICKKKAGADPLAGIAIESLMMTPLMLILMLAFLMDSLRAVSFPELLLLIGCCAARSLPCRNSSASFSSDSG